MTLEKNNNFNLLVLGRVLTNFGDSVYSITLMYIAVSIYNLDVSSLALFGLVSFLPSMISFLFGSFIDTFNNKKMLLVLLECIHFFTLTGVLITVYYQFDYTVLLILHGVFSFANTIIYPTQSSFVPEILHNDKEEMSKSVYIMNITNNITDLSSNLIASVILIYISTTNILVLDVFVFLLSILFFLRISNKNITKNNKKAQSEELKTGVKFSFQYFWSQKVPSKIVIMEGILSGLTTMIMRIVSIYLVVINVGVEFLGVLLAFQRGSEMLGTLISSKIKMVYKNFFMVDYLVSGIAIIMIVFVDNVLFKLVLFSITFLLIGMSGTVYGKMIYAYYEPQHMAKISTVISTISSVAIVTCMAIPMVYDDIEHLLLITGLITVLFGCYLLVFDKNSAHPQKKVLSKSA
ncbi:MFS transporter [Rossellomorea sp. NPDC077527]|uniref:MFS transporter n=1 Tax=Rossellomorea sp. NPDC077527 TaxID=3364510 RepID=UPI0037C5AA61